MLTESMKYLFIYLIKKNQQQQTQTNQYTEIKNLHLQEKVR